jgi:uncharacterized protein (DUF302 family)
MKKISILLTGLLLVSMELLASSANNQVFSVANADEKINAKSIEKAFNESGMPVDVNNDMNSIFSKRYKQTHHKQYNLAIFTNEKSITKLINKHPSIGLITPLSMSIYSDDKKNINISTLSLEGMARITNIPATNPDLIEYAKLLDTALHNALPKGKYLSNDNLARDDKNKSETKDLISEFTMELDPDEGETLVDAKDSFKEEFESEIGSVGFLIPKSYDLLASTKDDSYDFYDTYSIIRFNVIFPVSKEHPDAGSYAPFSLAIYKKKDEDNMHVSFPSISNWAKDLGISDKEALAEIEKTHGMMSDILEELTE